MKEAITVVIHLSIVIGLIVAVGCLIITQSKEFKDEYNNWKKDKHK